MKTICRLISVVLISMFVFSLTSCSGHEEIVPEKKQSSIVVKILKSSVKYGEDEDDQLIILPEVEGKVIDSKGTVIKKANVKLVLMPSNDLKDEVITDVEGTFTFYNVKKGDYELIVSSSGNVIGKNHIQL